MYIRKLLFILCVLSLFAGCSSSPKPKASPFESAPPETEAEAKALRRKQEKRKPASQVSIEKLQTREDKIPDAVQVFWQVPKEAVDGYILNYGFSEENLDQQETLYSGDIEIIDDEEKGLRYRFVIRDISAEQVIYLTITAFKDDTFGQPTDILTVNPD